MRNRKIRFAYPASNGDARHFLIDSWREFPEVLCGIGRVGVLRLRSTIREANRAAFAQDDNGWDWRAAARPASRERSGATN
jgi:hypothetical protein